MVQATGRNSSFSILLTRPNEYFLLKIAIQVFLRVYICIVIYLLINISKSIQMFTFFVVFYAHFVAIKARLILLIGLRSGAREKPQNKC